MNSNEAKKVTKEMEQAGFTCTLRKYNDSYSVDATDQRTGISITMHTAEQWAERKAAAEFDAKHSN